MKVERDRYIIVTGKNYNVEYRPRWKDLALCKNGFITSFDIEPKDLADVIQVLQEMQRQLDPNRPTPAGTGPIE